MFTLNTLQLIGIIAGTAFVSSVLGFFAAAMLNVSGRCSEEEERQVWPGSFEGKR